MEAKVVREFHLILDEWEFLTLSRLLGDEVLNIKHSGSTTRESEKIVDWHGHISEIKESQNLF